MEYKILEAHVIYNHPNDDFIIGVAIESAKNYWKAYYLQTNDISKESFQKVAAIGRKYPKHRALEIFEKCRLDEELKRHSYEG